jgi:hypothetical protein
MLRLIDKMESSKTVDSSVSITFDVRPIAANIIEPIETIYNGLHLLLIELILQETLCLRRLLFLVVSMLVMLL